jgi:hypothetical protein
MKEEVHNPDHYAGKTMQAIDVIEDFNLNYNLGSAAAYILRAGKKECLIKDLRKAIWYLEREIANSLNTEQTYHANQRASCRLSI